MLTGKIGKIHINRILKYRFWQNKIDISYKFYIKFYTLRMFCFTKIFQVFKYCVEYALASLDATILCWG